MKIVTSDQGVLQKMLRYRLDSYDGPSYGDHQCPTRDEGENNMPMQSQEQPTLNVKLVHFTKQNSPDEPVQVAFAVTDDQGKEEIITGEVPYSYDLFRVFQESGWLNIRRGVASIRESRVQRRVSA
jgi:hypothetical protein